METKKIFLRPTPSWLSPGRSTYSIARQNLNLQINMQGRLLNERHKSGLVLSCTCSRGPSLQNKSNARGKLQQTKQKQPAEQTKGSGDSQSVQRGLIQAVTSLCHHTWYGHKNNKQNRKPRTKATPGHTKG